MNATTTLTLTVRSMGDRSTAKLMFDVVSEAPMSARTRSTLRAFVRIGDCTGLLEYLERCCRTQRDVGRMCELIIAIAITIEAGTTSDHEVR